MRYIFIASVHLTGVLLNCSLSVTVWQSSFRFCTMLWFENIIFDQLVLQWPLSDHAHLKYFVIEIVITGSRLFRSASRSPSSPSEGFKGIKIKLQYVLEGMTSYRTMFIENWKEITTFDWLKSNKGLDLRVLRMVLWRAKYGQTWFKYGE